jgi:hypothetical protein
MQLRTILSAIISLGVFSSPAALADKRLPSYDALRAKMIREGYRPLKIAHGTDDYFCFQGFCEAYPEAVTCTAAGLPYCSMGFLRPSARGYIIVDTLGAGIHELDVVRRRVPLKGELCAMRELRHPCSADHDPDKDEDAAK